MNEWFAFLKKVPLKNARFLAAWPGMGSVALTVVNYLKDKLDAQFIGELNPEHYFAPTGASVSKQMIRPIDPPSNRFYYYRPSRRDTGLLFFIGSAQPIPHREYTFGKLMLQALKDLGVKSVFTTAAAPSDMHFRKDSRVFTVPNNHDRLKQMLEFGVHFMGEGTIAGLNGLLISIAAELNIDGMCLLGEIPFFTAQMEFPRAALAVLPVLAKLLEVDVDLVDLELFAREKDKEIESLANLLNSHKSDEDNSLSEQIIPPKQDEIPRSIRLRIERLFKQAEFDRTYKSKMRLKEELDKWELFDEYQDRFLDLFKKSRGES